MIAREGQQLRHATPADAPVLTALIALSARELSRGDYAPEQVDGALRGAFGVDTRLIEDGTYFVCEVAGRIVGCGGWSRRATLFGGDAHAARDDAELDPLRDAARIRAFFVHPEFARRGIGSLLLERCERDAQAHGFNRFELMATLPGVHLYAARGYLAGQSRFFTVAEGVEIQFVPMTKCVNGQTSRIEHAALQDAAAILELQKLAYQSEARLYEDWSLPPLTQTLESLRDEIASSTVLKAVLDNRIAGSVRAQLREGVCHVGRLVVHPDSQGRGLGSELMRRIEAEFPDAHCFELFTGHRSVANIRLYERLAYARVREKNLSPNLTLVYLQKSP